MTLFTEQQAQIAAAIAESLGVPADKVTADASFVDDLGADSLDMVELTMEMEERFDVEISDDEAANVKIVRDAFDLIAKKTA